MFDRAGHRSNHGSCFLKRVFQLHIVSVPCSCLREFDLANWFASEKTDAWWPDKIFPVSVSSLSWVPGNQQSKNGRLVAVYSAIVAGVFQDHEG